MSSGNEKEPRTVAVRVAGNLISQHEAFIHSEKANQIAPRTGRWRIPIATEVAVRAIQLERLKSAFTIQYDFHEGRFRRFDILVDTKTGDFYAFNDRNPGKTIAQVLLDRARELIGSCDRPLALVGFPWSAKTTAEAVKRIATNVQALLPEIAKDYLVTADGRVLSSASAPVWYISPCAEGSLVNTSCEVSRNAQDLAYCFDHDDEDSVTAFVEFIDSQRGRESKILTISQEVTENIPGILPRDSYRSFAVAAIKELRASLADEVLPKNVRTALDEIEKMSGRPGHKEALRIIDLIDEVHSFATDKGIHPRMDYNTGLPLIELAKIRASILAGNRPHFKEPRDRPIVVHGREVHLRR
jgi:hypothetical protein